MDKTTTALPYAEALFQLSQNSGEKGSELVDGFVNQPGGYFEKQGIPESYFQS